jgi:hypothetical protein
MQDWTVAELNKVLNDKNAPASKLAAARIWSYAAQDTRNSAGVPVVGHEVERIINHTAGKAKETFDVHTSGEVQFTLRLRREVDAEPAEN